MMENNENLINKMKAKWDDVYSNSEFVYGKNPNNYLKSQLQKLEVGAILFPAEGEGRNAVFASRLGWTVSAFDISMEGKKKAEKLAEEQGCKIEYKVGELQTLKFDIPQFDAIALIYAHFPPNIRTLYHKILNEYLKTGGTIILEAFSKKHIDYVNANPKIGGPRDSRGLFSIEEIRADFPNYEIIELTEEEIDLNEGELHNGKGSVIRFVGRKYH